MNQLLDADGREFIIGCNEHAFLVSHRRQSFVELVPSSTGPVQKDDEDPTKTTTNNEDDDYDDGNEEYEQKNTAKDDNNEASKKKKSKKKKRNKNKKNNTSNTTEVVDGATPLEIQAVAVMWDTEQLVYWCAVSRANKNLAIYKIHENELKQHRRHDNDGREGQEIKNGEGGEMIATIEPTLVYHTPKRVGSICFHSLPSNQTNSDANTTTTTTNSANTNHIVVVGDLAGDSYAYSLNNEKGRQKLPPRLLLGHTASMLTGVQIINHRIVTSDRDEKIRISYFPKTYAIEGYLLGHTAYITSFDTKQLSTPPQENDKSPITLVASCGGDRTIRLWNLQNMQQLVVVESNKTSPTTTGAAGNESATATNDEDKQQQEDEQQQLGLIPIGISLSSDCRMVAVIYDQSNRLEIYKIEQQRQHGNCEDDWSLKLVSSEECPSQPLSLSFQDDKALLVLTRDPEYVLEYEINTIDDDDDNDYGKMTATRKEDSLLFANLRRTIGTEKSVTMPETSLEKDKYGQPKLKKLEETRGPAAADAPWNRVERIDIAKKRSQRHKKRKIEKLHGSNNNNNNDDGDDDDDDDDKKKSSSN